jgi:hypothetical protein
MSSYNTSLRNTSLCNTSLRNTSHRKTSHRNTLHCTYPQVLVLHDDSQTPSKDNICRPSSSWSLLRKRLRTCDFENGRHEYCKPLRTSSILLQDQGTQTRGEELRQVCTWGVNIGMSPSQLTFTSLFIRKRSQTCDLDTSAWPPCGRHYKP